MYHDSWLQFYRSDQRRRTAFGEGAGSSTLLGCCCSKARLKIRTSAAITRQAAHPIPTKKRLSFCHKAPSLEIADCINNRRSRRNRGKTASLKQSKMLRYLGRNRLCAVLGSPFPQPQQPLPAHNAFGKTDFSSIVIRQGEFAYNPGCLTIKVEYEKCKKSLRCTSSNR